MITELNMPQLGLTMQTGIIVEWYKAEGDRIEVDEPVLVVETDKAATDVPSPATGILGRIMVDIGDEIPVGQIIAYIVDDESEIVNLPPGATRPVAATDENALHGGAPAPTTAAVASALDGVVVSSLAADGMVTAPVATGETKASPRARKKAMALGIDLATVAHFGSRIEEEDVIRASRDDHVIGSNSAPRLTPLAANIAAELGIHADEIESAPGARIRAASVLAAGDALPATPVGDPPVSRSQTMAATDGSIRELSRFRRVTAARMLLSTQTAPQVTYSCRVDVTEALALKDGLEEIAVARGGRLTLDAIMVRAVATALMENPVVNAQWVDAGHIRLNSSAHVGVAMDMAGNGLIVPVVRDAQERSLLDISSEIDRLLKGTALMALEAASGSSGESRGGKLGPDDYSGGTFTITNLGDYGVEFFTPVLNPPEAAILGVGSIQLSPVCRGGELTMRQMLALSLTADHRIVDGAPAAQFLGRVRDILEQPLLLLQHGL